MQTAERQDGIDRQPARRPAREDRRPRSEDRQRAVDLPRHSRRRLCLPERRRARRRRLRHRRPQEHGRRREGRRPRRRDRDRTACGTSTRARTSRRPPITTAGSIGSTKTRGRSSASTPRRARSCSKSASTRGRASSIRRSRSPTARSTPSRSTTARSSSTPASEFKQLAHNTFDEDNRANACLAVDRGQLLLRDDAYIYCLGNEVERVHPPTSAASLADALRNARRQATRLNVQSSA